MASKQDETLTKEDFLRAMELVAEKLKAPSALEQQKIDKELAETERRRKMMIEQATLDMNAKALRQGMCNHRKNEGRDEKYSLGGQINSDGNLHALCTRCQMELAVIKAPSEYHGVSFDADMLAQILVPTGALKPKPMEEIRRLQVEVNSNLQATKVTEGELAASLSS